MNNIRYFKSAWGDIKNSPGWFGKLCLLALLNLIPIFGQIVTLGYMYGWAREIAWGTHEPMPTRIFANEDGKLYRRGWFIFVLTFVVGLIATIVMSIGQSMQGVGLWGVAEGTHAAGSSILSGFGLLIYLIGLVGGLLLGILAWIGSMRISIYDRLSAGFQIGKIWKMFRHDTGGVMRIFGMNLLVGLILGFILSILYFIVFFLIILAGVAGLAASGYNVQALQYMTDAQAMAITMQFIASAGLVGILGFLLLTFVTLLAYMFAALLVARAMGYWMLQFDVPHWRGQDDPMPFETAAQPVYPYSPTEAASMPATPYSAPVQQENPQTWQQAQSAVQPSEPVEQAFSQPVVVNANTNPPAVDAEFDSAVDNEPTTEELPVSDSGASAEPTASVEPVEPTTSGAPVGFTYSGVAPEPAQPVTPSGADPSAETVPDLIVVIPDAEPSKDTPAE